MLDIEVVARAVAAGPRTIVHPRAAAGQRAAVALVFAGADGLNLCLIRRSTHPRDPWSGQMAFPGGRVAPEDAAAVDAAIRETREEVGLDLTGALRLGALPEIPLVGRGRPLGGVVAPFAFYAGAELPELRIDPVEVAAAYWIELSYLRDPCHRTTLEREVSGTPRQLPAIRFQDTLIWGMTYRILTALLEAIEADPIAAERAR